MGGLINESNVSDSRIKPLGNASMWAVSGDSYLPCEKSVKELPPAQYTLEVSEDRGIYLTKKGIELDDIIDLPDSVAEEVVGEIEKFWAREEVYRKYGFLWKRGILMWGPPASGKTTTIQMVSKKIIEQGGISVYMSVPKVAAYGLEMIRKIEPKRPILCIMEDLDAICMQHGESDLLSLLDGELQVDNVVFVSTTNYPEKLDKRIVNRPSRFDKVLKVPFPSDEARRKFLLIKEPELAEQTYYDEDKGTEIPLIDKWVKETKDFSIAHLKELVISVRVYDSPFEQVVKRLKKMSESISSRDGNGIGF